MLLLYATLVALAATNRETSLVLVFCYLAYYPTRWRQAAFLALVWGTVTLAIHVGQGSAEHMLGLMGTFQYNLNTLPDALFTNVLLIPLWIAAGIGYRRATGVLKRLAWVALLYMAAIVIGGAWSEMQRLALPVVILIIPLIVGVTYD